MKKRARKRSNATRGKTEMAAIRFVHFLSPACYAHESGIWGVRQFCRQWLWRSVQEREVVSGEQAQCPSEIRPWSETRSMAMLQFVWHRRYDPLD